MGNETSRVIDDIQGNISSKYEKFRQQQSTEVIEKPFEDLTKRQKEGNF